MSVKHRLISSILISVFAAVNPALAEHADTPIGDAVSELPIFDAHIHYKEPAWADYSVSDIVGLMDRNGVEHSHDGIGEFHIRSRAMWDEDLFRDIIAMAKARDLFLHVHSGAEPIRWLYDLDPDVKIIWAHAGLGEPASEVFRLMSEYPTLMADTSLREYAILGFDETLDPEWQKIIFDFQDRLMVGSDTWVNSQWDNYESIIASNRRWLSKLPRSIAEKIAYRNAARFFNRDISNDLIGTR